MAYLVPRRQQATRRAGRRPCSQLISALCIRHRAECHPADAGMQISDLVASVGNSNPCSLYFLNVLIDTTIGK